jgi:hypothetical protein
MSTFAVIDAASKNVLGEFGSRAEAEALVAELVEAAPNAERDLTLYEVEANADVVVGSEVAGEILLRRPSFYDAWSAWLTPEAIADELGLSRDEVVRVAIEHAIPIRHGKLPLTVVRAYLTESGARVT